MLYPIELAAVTASAIYGVLLGLRKGFDAVGLATVAMAVAFGGGTLRDLLLDRRPLFWVENEHFLWIVLALALIGATLPHRLTAIERRLALPDALGLGLFSVAGAAYAVQADMPLLTSALMGVITGAFGGVIGDVICNETPSLFRPSPLHATCALVGALAYILLDRSGCPQGLAQTAGILLASTSRMLAIRFNICLPARQAPASEEEGG